MQKTKKSRHWGFVVYPEGDPPAPPNWIEQLKLTGLRVAISPLHDKDLKVDGSDEEKKAHWHVLACWDGPTTYNAAKAITDSLNAPIPQALNSVKGYYRYFTHQDDPEKYQYSESEIQHLNGFDPLDFLEWTKSELEKYKREVFEFIRNHRIYEYADLLEILADSELNSLFTVATNNTIVFTAYLASRRYQLLKKERNRHQ